MKSTLFEVYVWFSNKTGWVHNSFVRGTSWEQVLQNYPQYADKHKYLITVAR